MAGVSLVEQEDSCFLLVRDLAGLKLFRFDETTLSVSAFHTIILIVMILIIIFFSISDKTTMIIFYSFILTFSAILSNYPKSCPHTIGGSLLSLSCTTNYLSSLSLPMDI